MNPLDKEEKIAKQNLLRLTNHVKSEYTFHKKRTFGDYLLSLGYSEEQIRDTLHYVPHELTRQITFNELKELLEDLDISLRVKYWLKRNPPPMDQEDSLFNTDSMFSRGFDPPDKQEWCNIWNEEDLYEAINQPSNDRLNILLKLSEPFDKCKIPPERDEQEIQTEEKKEIHVTQTHSINDEAIQQSIHGGITTLAKDDSNKDYGLPPSPKEKCTLFWFQKRDTKRLLDGALVKKQRAQMLVAQAGHGKTFILGAFVRRLLDINYHVGKTITAWPYFYITKASVVEQTKRVMRDKFSIDLIHELTVTNYDQLRATLGELYLEEKTIVENNEEHIVWNWRPMFHPLVFIIDECQAAKNRDSVQSKIIRAIGNIKHPDIRIIFSSATPFTRVIESEYFVVNAGIDYAMI